MIGRPRTSAIFVLCAALALLAGPVDTEATGPDALPSVKLPTALERVLRDYEAAWQRKDAGALAALFTEDGFVLSSGRPPVRGRERIEERYAGSGGPLALRALAWATDGDLGFIIGAYARERGDPDIGKFTLVLRKVSDGRWLIVSDMDNGNARPPAAPAPSPGSEAGREEAGEAEVHRFLESYYAAFSDRDWPRFEEHFWSGATLTTVWTPEGEEAARVMATPIKEFIRKAPEGPGSRSIFEERMVSSTITVRGSLAQAWTSYTARFGDPGDVMEWEGIDAFTLMKHEGEWRIVSLAYASSTK